ncbi:unnamed protein product [Rhizophagus irregularis]|nr:unnamed protein product [Rhizophagus irregularis]
MSSHQQMLDQNGFRQNQINDFTCSHTKFNQKINDENQPVLAKDNKDNSLLYDQYNYATQPHSTYGCAI